jgi:hypothetical protein
MTDAPQRRLCARSPGGAYRSPDGASRCERGAAVLPRRSGRSEELRYSPVTGSPSRWGSEHPRLDPLPALPLAGSRSRFADQAEIDPHETGGAETAGQARLLVTVRFGVPTFSLQQNVEVYRRPRSEVGLRAPTRFAEGGQFAAPLAMAPRNRSPRRSVRRGALDSSTPIFGDRLAAGPSTP